MKAIMYGMMLIWDFIVLYGIFYLIDQRAWNSWWVLVGIIICSASNPKFLLNSDSPSKIAEK